MVASKFSVQRITYYLVSFCVILGMLYVGRAFFIPIAYGIFFAFMLKPLRDRIEKVIPNRVVAILLCYLLLLLTLGSIMFFFAIQIREVITSADNIAANLGDSAQSILMYCGSYLGWTEVETTNFLENNLSASIEQPLGILTTSLSTSSVIITNLVLIFIYAFFFLLYSTAFKRFALGQFTDESQLEGMQTLREVQAVASSYLGGMLTVMLVLGVLNSLGLYLIGIPYALLWGFLGAFLAIIPYIGTALGGLLPFLYSIAITDTVWQPVMVLILYFSVQSVEGNFITPKVVGNSVKINALAAVLAIIFGSFLWGFAGLIIAIPLLAMVRIILQHVQAMKPVALLLSDDLYDHSIRFIGEYNQPKHRLSSFLQDGKPVWVRSGGKPLNRKRKTNPQIIADPKTQQGNRNPGRQQPLVSKRGGHLYHEDGAVKAGHGAQDNGVPVQPEQPAQQQVQQGGGTQGEGGKPQ